MRDGYELLCDMPMIARGREIMRTMKRSGPGNAVVTDGYHGTRKVLMMYGAGAIWRQDYMREHLARGGRVVCLDLAYWDKTESLRFAIDGMHPTPAHIDATAPSGRPFPDMSNKSSQSGPVILIGMSSKGRRHYGLGGASWELEKLESLRARFPGVQILYRKKGKKPSDVEWPQAPDGNIFDSINGASLIVCKHSNVAVDACVSGIPVECDGGAAQWLYRHGTTPGIKHRREFLGRLANWQYGYSEAAKCWGAIERALT